MDPRSGGCQGGAGGGVIPVGIGDDQAGFLGRLVVGGTKKPLKGNPDLSFQDNAHKIVGGSPLAVRAGGEQPKVPGTCVAIRILVDQVSSPPVDQGGVTPVGGTVVGEIGTPPTTPERCAVPPEG